ncbi:MAG: translation initiation factor IF-3 [Chloroflexota bacterium]|nr:translation initiation factor IF-3 [Chloroflexota bacterium]
MIKKLRVNESIRAKEVRLIGEKSEQLGIMPLYQAREIAKKQNLDLVEIAPTAEPPVCRLLDYGKFKYEQAKKERELRKSQKVSVVREVRLRPSIDDHDLESKARSIHKLLNGGDKVKVTVMFRGREIIHSNLGWKLLQRLVESTKDVASMERQPFMEGNRMSIILSPAASQKAAPAATTQKVGAAVEEVKEGVKS